MKSLHFFPYFDTFFTNLYTFKYHFDTFKEIRVLAAKMQSFAKKCKD